MYNLGTVFGKKCIFFSHPIVLKIQEELLFTLYSIRGVASILLDTQDVHIRGEIVNIHL